MVYSYQKEVLTYLQVRNAPRAKKKMDQIHMKAQRLRKCAETYAVDMDACSLGLGQSVVYGGNALYEICVEAAREKAFKHIRKAIAADVQFSIDEVDRSSNVLADTDKKRFLRLSGPEHH